MAPVRIEDPALRRRIRHLFRHTEDSMLDSFAQGYMGTGWCDDAAAPTCAMIAIRKDFLFVGGDAATSAARELAAFEPLHDSFFVVPDDDAWFDLLHGVYAGRSIVKTRYAMARDASGFDRDRLRAFVRSVPEGVEVRRYDVPMARLALSQEWSFDQCAGFESAEAFVERGVGYGALRGGELIAGAASFGVFDEGIEVQIDTRDDCRRQGLALACGAALVLECLDRGLFPCWDAAHAGSRALAEKLGYRLRHEYRVLSVNDREDW